MGFGYWITFNPIIFHWAGHIDYQTSFLMNLGNHKKDGTMLSWDLGKGQTPQIGSGGQK